MRKLIYILCICLPTLLSCEKEIQFTGSPSLIRFGVCGLSMHTETRAVSISTVESLRSDGFRVCAIHSSGLELFDEQACWAEDGHCFEPVSHSCWPDEGTLSFYACFPATAVLNRSSDGMSLEYEQDSGMDLIAASRTALEKDQGNVALVFSHILSRMAVSWSAPDNGIDYELSRIELYAPSTGTYSFSSGKWTAENESCYDYTGGEMSFIPGELTMRVQWTCSQGADPIGNYEDSVKLCLAPGVLSSINLELPSPSGSGIEWTVEVKPWNSVDMDPFEFYFEGTADDAFNVSVVKGSNYSNLSTVSVVPDESGVFRTYLPELPDACHYVFKSDVNTGNAALTSITQLPYVVSKSGNYSYMFKGCTSLSSIPELNMSSSTNAIQIFASCSSLTSLKLDDTGNVKNFKAAFSGCSSLESVSPLDLSSCLICESMFEKCSSIKDIAILNTAKVATFRSAFSNCKALESISSLDLESCTNCTQMFYSCPRLSSVSLENTGNAGGFAKAFAGCSSLASVSSLDLASCTTCENMFVDCRALASLSLQNTGSVVNFRSAFSNCSSMESIMDLDLSSCTNCTQMFNSCSSLLSVNLVNTGNVGGFYAAFSGCAALRTVSALDLSSCVNCEKMFNGCSSLQSIELSHTGSVTTFKTAFASCRSLVIVQGMDLESCTNCTQMFYSCGMLQSLSLAHSENVQGYAAAFSECSSLESISGVNLSSCSNCADLFKKCTSLRSIDGLGEVCISLYTSSSSSSRLEDTIVDRDSVIGIFSGLQSVEGDHSIRLSSTTMSALSDADMAIATEKGWTLII